MLRRLLPFAFLLAAGIAFTQDAKQLEPVPKGETFTFPFEKSKVFPGTTRNVTVYIPKQFDGKTPACVYVNQDGVQYNAPAVFDRAHRREGDACDHWRVRDAGIGQGTTPGRAAAVQPQL